MKRIFFILSIISFILTAQSCRNDEPYVLDENVEHVTYPLTNTKVIGFFLLNEGNMGMNRASIDYFDYTMGDFHHDIYASRNPTQVKELGDVGNDIQIYRNKVYAIINCSNYMEVTDLNGKHLKGIQIPNCRYVVFKGNKAYVSSYATPVSTDTNAGKGLVFEIDTETLEITRKVEVGYQPEEMAIYGNKLYVANSGGYRVPHYDHTVSVIDLNSFQNIQTIDVAINLHRMVIKPDGSIYVSSRGDYYHIPPRLYKVDAKTGQTVKQINIPVTDMCLDGDLLYYIGVSFSYITGQNTISYGILDTKTDKVISDHIITDGTDKRIMMPYSIAINPDTKEIIITDAQDYVVSGVLYCFSKAGRLEWKTVAGNIPAHIAFVQKY